MTGTTVPAIIAIRIRRYQQAFRAAGAVTPDTAVRPSDAGLRESLVFRKLVRHRILVPVSGNRYYLDEARVAAVQHRKRRMLAVWLLVILVLLAGVALTVLVF